MPIKVCMCYFFDIRQKRHTGTQRFHCLLLLFILNNSTNVRYTAQNSGRSKIYEAKRRQFVKLFAIDQDALQVAKIAGVNQEP